jgi:hypothetical protein
VRHTGWKALGEATTDLAHKLLALLLLALLLKRVVYGVAHNV